MWFEDTTLEDYCDYGALIKDLSNREHSTVCHVFRKWSDSNDTSKRSIYENIKRRDFREESYVKYLTDLWDREREEVEDFLYSDQWCDIYEMYDDDNDIHGMFSGDGCPHPGDDDFGEFIEKVKKWLIRNTPLTKEHSKRMEWWFEETEYFDPPDQKYITYRCAACLWSSNKPKRRFKKELTDKICSYCLRDECDTSYDGDEYW